MILFVAALLNSSLPFESSCAASAPLPIATTGTYCFDSVGSVESIGCHVTHSKPSTASGTTS
jgi:hypothetical protein